MSILRLYPVVTIFFLLGLNACEDAEISVEQIRCDYRENAVGVGRQPVFSWILASGARNQVQIAYQIQVSDELKSLQKGKGTIWNSGKVLSERSVGIIAPDLKLHAGKKYYWKVKVWDREDRASAWSRTGEFITALFDESDWGNARWIAWEEMPDSMVLVPGIPTWGRNTRNIAVRRPVIPLFRREFRVEKKVESALLFISGLGHYKAFINGNQVSDDFLSPGWTHYRKTCQYNCYDVTAFLTKAQNVIGAIVGNGFYNINNERYRKLLITYGMPKVIARLQINYADGSTESVVTGSDWKTLPSPVTYSSMYGGENYNATLEEKGWSAPGYDDSLWRDVILCKASQGRLVPETTYPVKTMETFKPDRIVPTGKNSFMVDFGQNASGIIRIKVRGNRGDTLRIVPSELVYADNSPNQSATGSPYYYEYILKGEGIETWQPLFTYYGFRYAQVYGAQPTGSNQESDKPELLEIVFLHTHSSAPVRGSFWCSDPLLNQIDTLIRYAIQSNMQSVLTDCPHREKLGWLEQTYLMGEAIQYNYEIYPLYRKIVRDMMDSQRGNGLVGSIAPEYIVFGDAFSDSPEWGSAMIMLPWLVYKWYGDTTLMQEAWPAMQRYVKYLDSKAQDHILDYGLGDWYDLGPDPPGFSQLTPKAATATASYFLDYKLLSEMASLLNKPEEARLYATRSGQIRDAYNRLLFKSKTGLYAQGSQTAMAIPLSIHLVDEPYREKVFQNLIDSIISNDYTLTAGDIGFHYLIDALTQGGKSQLIYQMNERDDIPGYGYQIRKGATALTESWEALPGKSNNHLMLGHLEEWFYTGLGGILQEENSAGYKQILIKPALVNDLEQVKTSFYSPYGLIESAWENREDEYIFHFTIPVNTSARIILPAGDIEDITEGGRALKDVAEIRPAGQAGEGLIVLAGSGKYVFSVKKK